MSLAPYGSNCYWDVALASKSANGERVMFCHSTSPSTLRPVSVKAGDSLPTARLAELRSALRKSQFGASAEHHKVARASPAAAYRPPLTAVVRRRFRRSEKYF